MYHKIVHLKPYNFISQFHPNKFNLNKCLMLIYEKQILVGCGPRHWALFLRIVNSVGHPVG